MVHVLFNKKDGNDVVPHILTHSLAHSLTQSLSLSLTHSPTHSLTHTHTLTHSHSPRYLTHCTHSGVALTLTLTRTRTRGRTLTRTLASLTHSHSHSRSHSHSHCHSLTSLPHTCALAKNGSDCTIRLELNRLKRANQPRSLGASAGMISAK